MYQAMPPAITFADVELLSQAAIASPVHGWKTIVWFDEDAMCGGANRANTHAWIGMTC